MYVYIYTYAYIYTHTYACHKCRTRPYSDAAGDADHQVWADLEGPCWQRAFWRVLGSRPLPHDVVALPHHGLGALRWMWFEPSAATRERCRQHLEEACAGWVQAGLMNEQQVINTCIVCSLPPLIARLVAHDKLAYIGMSLSRRCSQTKMPQLHPLKDLRQAIAAPDPSDGGFRLDSSVFRALANMLDDLLSNPLDRAASAEATDEIQRFHGWALRCAFTLSRQHLLSHRVEQGGRLAGYNRRWRGRWQRNDVGGHVHASSEGSLYTSIRIKNKRKRELPVFSQKKVSDTPIVSPIGL